VAKNHASDEVMFGNSDASETAIVVESTVRTELRRVVALFEKIRIGQPHAKAG
jgi:hypothetical protein